MDGFMEEAGFLMQTIITGMIYYGYRESAKILSRMERLQVHQVGQELDWALKTGSKNGLEYVAVKGSVYPTSEPVMTSTGIPSVIKLQQSYDHFRNRLFGGQWSGSQQLVGSTSTFVPFALKNPMGGNGEILMIHVDQPASAELHSVLTTVGTTFKEHKGSIVQSFLSIFGGKEKDGTEVTEKVLLVDTLLTVIGKLVRRPDGAVQLEHPKHPEMPYIFSAGSIEAVVASFRSQKNTYLFGTVLFGTITAVLAFRLASKYLRDVYSKRLCREIVRRRNPKGISGLSDSQICIACLGNPREVLFSPCGHICTCVECWMKLQDQRCPVCREKIKYTIPAFIP